MSSSEATPSGAARGRPLRSLGDRPIPGPVAEDWERFRSLPSAARDAIWEILGPFLSLGPGTEFERRCDAYCKLRELQPAGLLPALNACQFLVHEAIARNLDEAAFAKDLELLPDEDGRARAVLASGYAQARSSLRARIVNDTVLDHGGALMGVDWRIDHVVSSSRGLELNAPIALVTFRYRVGDRTERLTLQADPERLAELRAACDRILGPQAGDGGS